MSAGWGNRLAERAAGPVREYLAELPRDTRTAWCWDALGGALFGAFQGMTWTFVLKIGRDVLRATPTQIAWMLAAPALGYIFATIWARQMDGRAKLPFCTWTWFISRGLYLATPLLHNRASFVSVAVASYLIASVSAPAYAAVMKEVYPDKHRGRLMSTVRIGVNTATLIAALATGSLLDRGVDWHLLLTIGGVFGIGTAFTFARLPVKAPARVVGPRLSTGRFVLDTLGILRRNHGYRWYTASVFVYGFGNLMASTLYPLYQLQVFHVTNTQVALLANMTAVLTVVGFFFWGGFLDRRGPLATVLLAIAVICLQPVMYALAWNPSHHMPLLYAAAAAGGLAASGIDLGYINTTLLFAEEGKAAQYQALHSSFFGVRGTIAPFCSIPLMGWLGYRPAFLVSLAIMLGGVGLQLVSMRDYRREAREQAAQSRTRRTRRDGRKVRHRGGVGGPT